MSEKLDSDQKFWLGFWCILGLVATVLLGCITTYHVKDLEARKALADKGYTALEVQCAVDSRLSDDPTCVLLGVKEVTKR
jgi:hypothetical protein